MLGARTVAVVRATTRAFATAARGWAPFLSDAIAKAAMELALSIEKYTRDADTVKKKLAPKMKDSPVPGALRGRIQDCGAKMLVTADEGLRDLPALDLPGQARRPRDVALVGGTV